MEIRPERKIDFHEIEALFDLCFSLGRMALSSYRFREGVSPVRELCFIARDNEDILCGAIRN